MNDEHSAQLTYRWRIPTYAQRHLWVTSYEQGVQTNAVQTQGEYGLFTLTTPATVLTVRWGNAEGAPLAQLAWRTDCLEWDGAVRLGGYFDALHITQADDLALGVVLMGAHPLKPGVGVYPTAGARAKAPYSFPAATDIDDSLPEQLVTWLVGDESLLFNTAQDAMNAKLRVYAFGRLADEGNNFHKRFALPLLLEALTLFAP
jgi:hypothetical protein